MATKRSEEEGYEWLTPPLGVNNLYRKKRELKTDGDTQ